jgi:putative ATPase
MAGKDIKTYGHLPVPLVIRNAPTRMMKDMNYGKGYQYAHNYQDALVQQQHLPDKLQGRKYYYPTERGFEKEIKRRMAVRKDRLSKNNKK